MLISDKHSLNLQYFAFNATIPRRHWQLGLVNVQDRFKDAISALACLSIPNTVKMITAHPAEQVVKRMGDVAKEKVRSDAKRGWIRMSCTELLINVVFLCKTSLNQ